MRINKKTRKEDGTELEEAISSSESESELESEQRGAARRKLAKPAPTKRYQHASDMSKSHRDALRRDIFWNLARMPAESQLDIAKTFESQKDLVVKTIVPNLIKTLDLDTYPIGEGVVYEMLHQRHRHQRDNIRIKNKSENDRKREAERKHVNSRRSEKRRRRSRTINKLKEANDPLIRRFKEEELLPIMNDNGYHSPEISEDDDDENDKIVVIRNLHWRSSTLRKFLLYIDQNTKKGIKKRKRFYKTDEYIEGELPSNASDWTKSGYDGPLKILVNKAVSKYLEE